MTVMKTGNRDENKQVITERQKRDAKPVHVENQAHGSIRHILGRRIQDVERYPEEEIVISRVQG
jgi:uncharacterized transporter YbjL